LGSANQNPRFGPVLISEVMYHPPAPSTAALAIDPTLVETDLEFIEISNPTGAPLVLTDWRVRGGVDFDMPAGTQLAPGSSLLIVPFDPASPLNVTLLSAFKTQYGLTDSVKLIGGYVGQLSNGGDPISLQQPEAPLPDEPNIIPRVTADEIVYDDLAPWPTAADGTGASLQRTGSRTFGHAAGSWRAAAPTPGTFVTDEALPGDFNADGLTNAADMELLCDALQQGSANLLYDLNGDHQVNDLDRDRMVREILGTDYGDANLDGIFNSSDLIQVFQFGEYEDGVAGNSSWASGDFNCDGEFDTGDLLLAFQAGAYVAAAEPAAVAVQTMLAAVARADGGDVSRPSTDMTEKRVDAASAPLSRDASHSATRRVATESTRRTSLFAAHDEYFAHLAEMARQYQLTDRESNVLLSPLP
jgi:hypothetical protein